MTRALPSTAFAATLLLGLAPFVSLGCSSDGRAPANGETGASCENASQCYPNVAAGTLEGEAICLDRVEGGYCTHSCVTDDDCCAAAGECPRDRHQVCSPFESTGEMMCLLACEARDIEADRDAVDGDDYCARNAGEAFGCRSSGGGAKNRKVCMPRGDDCGAGGACP